MTRLRLAPCHLGVHPMLFDGTKYVDEKQDDGIGHQILAVFIEENQPHPVAEKAVTALKQDRPERVAHQGRVPVAETITILTDAAKGLVFAELRGIVHRDIKPANLMRDGFAAVMSRDDRRAVDRFTAALELRPGNAQALFNLARVRLRLADADPPPQRAQRHRRPPMQPNAVRFS